MKATKVMIAVVMGIVGVGALAPSVVSAGVQIEFLGCRPTADIFNPGFPVCDLQTGVAQNDLFSAPPAGPLVVLEPDTFEHQSEWESVLAAPLTILPGPVTLDLVLTNMGENTGSNDICWSKHAVLPDGSEIIIVPFHCFENPLPVAGFICPFGAVAPAIPANCLAAAGLVTETVVSSIVAPTVLPAGTVIELSLACPGASFLAVFFNGGLDVDGDGVDEFSKITEPANEPPDCTAAAPDPDELWPPNHKFHDVSIVGVTDPDGDPVTITITGIAQDEPLEGLGDGNTCPDADGVGTDIAVVRAERSGTKTTPGDGRVYHISFTAEDGQGGECSETVTVCVPHDQRPGHVCVDQGPLFDSTVCGE